MIRLECIRDESSIYFMDQKNGLLALGYNSAESEPILIKFEPNVAGWPCRFWARSVATVWKGAEFFFFSLNNARFRRFPVGQILRHFNTTTSIGEAVKTIGTWFWKFYRKGSFFQKPLKTCWKFPRFATSSHAYFMYYRHLPPWNEWNEMKMRGF